MMCRQTHSLVFLSLLCGFLTFPLPLSLLFSLFLTPPSFNSAIFSCSSFLSRCLRIPLRCICILSEGLHFTEHVCYRWLPGSPHVSHSQGDKRCVWDRNGTRHHLLPHSIFHIESSPTLCGGVFHLGITAVTLQTTVRGVTHGVEWGARCTH